MNKPGIKGTSFKLVLTKDWWFKDFSEMEKEQTIKEINKKLMEQEYFTPEIEDIRVGYECEVLHSILYPVENREDKFWQKEKLECRICIDLDLSKIRTPYLTKEQIESKGWKFTSTIFQSLPAYKRGEGGFNRYTKEYFIMQHYTSQDRVIISDGISIIYNGECKDINTFRYISKLIGIK